MEAVFAFRGASAIPDLPFVRETMSAPTPSADPATDPAAVARLAQLRREIDRIDDAIHDLLMQRAEVVARVGREGGKGGVALRPGREAEIIRRLLARHQGGLPARVLPRIWRELFAATTTMQGSYVITVCEPDASSGGASLLPAAREHFGALTPLRVHRTPAQAIGEVSARTAIAAILPMPREDETPREAWWTALMHRDEPRIHVVARLPFWAQRPEGAPQARALVVAAVAPDASSRDRSLVGLELDPATSRTRLTAALVAAGLPSTSILLRRDPVAAQALVEVDGMVAETDPRLAALTDVLRKPVVLGGYAVPVEGDTP